MLNFRDRKHSSFTDISHLIHRNFHLAFLSNSVLYCYPSDMYMTIPRLLIAVTPQWAPWRLKSPVSRLFAQAFVQAHNKENIKAPPRH